MGCHVEDVQNIAQVVLVILCTVAVLHHRKNERVQKNEVPEDVVEAGNITFQRQLDRCMDKKVLERYESNVNRWS